MGGGAAPLVCTYVATGGSSYLASLYCGLLSVVQEIAKCMIGLPTRKLARQQKRWSQGRVCLT
jgi:hypothetical protein